MGFLDEWLCVLGTGCWSGCCSGSLFCLQFVCIPATCFAKESGDLLPTIANGSFFFPPPCSRRSSPRTEPKHLVGKPEPLSWHVEFDLLGPVSFSITPFASHPKSPTETAVDTAGPGRRVLPSLSDAQTLVFALTARRNRGESTESSRGSGTVTGMKTVTEVLGRRYGVFDWVGDLFMHLSESVYETAVSKLQPSSEKPRPRPHLFQARRFGRLHDPGPFRMSYIYYTCSIVLVCQVAGRFSFLNPATRAAMPSQEADRPFPPTHGKTRLPGRSSTCLP